MVVIHEQLSKIYYFKGKNMKFYDSNFELLLCTFCAGLFQINVCLYILNFCIVKKDKNIQGPVHKLAIYMYDTKNNEFKFPQLRGHLIKLIKQTVQDFI